MADVQTRLAGTDAGPSAWSGDHYHVQSVARGVWAARPTAAQGALYANAALVDLGRRTLLVDAGISAAAGSELAEAAHALTGRRPDFVLYTHYHGDHVWGCTGAVTREEIDASVEIVSSAGTRQMLQAVDAGSRSARATPEIACLQAQQTQGSAGPPRPDEAARRFVAAALDASACAAVRRPTMTFDRRLCLYGTERSLEAVCYGGGHTRSDVVAWIPEAGVLVAGDLVTVETHPFLADGDAAEWIHILRSLKTHQPSVVIPGHGPPSGGEALEEMVRYIESLLELAAGAPVDIDGRENDETALWLESVSPPEQYAGWALDALFGPNLRHEVRRLTGGRGYP